MEKTREFYKSFYVAAFTYHEGYLVFDELKVGSKLHLAAEPNNRHDENAVAIYYNDIQIGYVPSAKNYSMSKLLKMGHNPFEVVVQQKTEGEHPERQLRVVVYVKK